MQAAPLLLPFTISFSLGQRLSMDILQIPFKHTEEAIERLPILAAADINQVIPPAGIAILIPYHLFVIPVNERLKERKLIFFSTQAESMIHA